MRRADGSANEKGLGWWGPEVGAEALVPSQPSADVSQTRFSGVLGGI